LSFVQREWLADFPDGYGDLSALWLLAVCVFDRGRPRFGHKLWFVAE
jgi:hypothetical protein